MPFNKKMKVVLALLGIAIMCDAQIQIGQDIEGEFENDEFGHSIAVSADGQTIAIGGYRNDDKAYLAGHVRVYKVSNGEWLQLGSDIDGQEKWDGFGFSVALSDDGNRLIVGSLRLNGTGARAFEFINGEWLQIGQNISIREANDVAISSDGNVVAVADYHFPQPASHTGVVRIYEWKDGEWTKMGGDIDGEHEKDQAGWSVSLSGDGKTVAIGSINSNEGGNDSGHVRIFRFIGEEWILLGTSIAGKGKGYSFGWSVSMSTNGNRVAIGGSGSLYFEERPCYFGVYEFINGEWKMVGQEIDGYVNEGFGREVVLSGAGNRVVVASPNNKNCPVRIYDLIDGEWKHVGKSIKNKRVFDATGSSIGMSKDGKIVATGSRLSGDGTSSGAGYAHVYNIADIMVEENLDEDCEELFEEEDEEEIKEYNLFPNPTSGNLTVNGFDLEGLIKINKLKLFDILGRRIEGYEVEQNNIDLSQIPAGIYLLIIDEKIEKIIKIQ
jgi:WD40 repeat protein